MNLPLSSPDPARDPLRAQMRSKRRDLSASQRIDAAQALLRQLKKLPGLVELGKFSGYWACHGELPLNLAVASLSAQGKKYFLPVLNGPRTLAFAAWTQDVPLHTNRYGIPEPHVDPSQYIAATELDLLFLPLLAFTRQGMRLGSGGGYYDTSLAFLLQRLGPEKPLLVGVGYAFQEVAPTHPALHRNSWDVTLDYILTDAECIPCPH